MQIRICRLFLLLLLLLVSQIPLFSKNQPLVNDPHAVALATQAMAALTNGVTVADATLTGNATSIAGSDNETGSATLRSKGLGESRIDLSLGGGQRSEIRNNSTGLPQGVWIGLDGTSHSFAQHNCWTDASWFFPAFSSLAQTSNPSFLFSYVGQEQHRGVSTQHLQVSQLPINNFPALPRLSAIDFYLDPVSSLPLAIVFKTHPDGDMNTDIAVEILFGDYRAVNGVQIPFHIQRLINGGLVLDVVGTSALINSGIPDSTFAIQ